MKLTKVLRLVLGAVVLAEVATAGISTSLQAAGTGIDNTTVGGAGTNAINWSDSGDKDGMLRGHYLTADIAAIMHNPTGIVKAYLDTTSDIPPTDPASRADGAFGWINMFMNDEVTIQPGNGHDNGDTVRIRFFSEVEGAVLNDAAQCYLYYQARLGINGSVADHTESDFLDTGAFSSTDDRLVDVVVGNTYPLTLDFRLQVNQGSEYSGDFHSAMLFQNTGQTTVGYATGYEDLIIELASGGTPIPEPTVCVLLALGVPALLRRRR